MLLGVEGWQDFGLHDCRREFVTKLSNSPDVSLAQTMASARHTSVSASKTYQRVDVSSEMNKFNALQRGFNSSISSSHFNSTEMTYPSATMPSIKVDNDIPSSVLMENNWANHENMILSKKTYQHQTPNHLPHHACEMQTFPRPPNTCPYPPSFKSNPTPWSYQRQQDPMIDRYPASLFSPQELAMKRQMNLVVIDDNGNEFVYVRKY